ncbi:hypothetical protein NDU88_009451 [Pleurodeles waltl]|uniref:Uncharacterized protein n=1 Tax=Pleurodeles waltl TaxID=8319 RepID=A0AAV7QVB4_PLEWA|nr:hypothetical protein NDU88_009451 [Pleurodeles waltl]
MEPDTKVLEAVALLRQAGRLDLLKEGALAPTRPARRASAGVAAAVAACSPPRGPTGGKVRGPSRGVGAKGGLGAGKGSVRGRVRVGDSPRVSRAPGRAGRRPCLLPAANWGVGRRGSASRQAFGAGQVGGLVPSAGEKESVKVAGPRRERRGGAGPCKLKPADAAAPAAAGEFPRLAFLHSGGRGEGAAVGSVDMVSSSGVGQQGVLAKQEAEGDPKIPLSEKWPTMLQWSSDEEGDDVGSDGKGRCPDLIGTSQAHFGVTDRQIWGHVSRMECARATRGGSRGVAAPSGLQQVGWRVRVGGRPPVVELWACWTFNLCGPAAWAVRAAEFLGVEKGSSSHDWAPTDGLGWSGGQHGETKGVSGGESQAPCHEHQIHVAVPGYPARVKVLSGGKSHIFERPVEIWRWLEMWDKVAPARPERASLTVHRASGVASPDWRTRRERQMEGTVEQVVDIDPANRVEIQHDGTMAVVTPGLDDGSVATLDQGTEKFPADT